MPNHTKENQEYIDKALVGVHSETMCHSDICVIHNPSGHHMHEWPLHFRSDRGIMERTCSHGVGHPDPDDFRVANSWAERVHGCDGCCDPNILKEIK